MLAELAESALMWAWAYKWAAILGVGQAPSLIRLGLKYYKRQIPAEFHLFNRACALIACLICISSLPLIIDSFKVESGSASAFMRIPCTLQAAVVKPGVAVEVQCEDGAIYHLESGGPPSVNESGQLYLLAASKIPVYFEACGRAEAGACGDTWTKPSQVMEPLPVN